MFNVADGVTNNSPNAQTLYPFAYVAREGVPRSRPAGCCIRALSASPMAVRRRQLQRLQGSGLPAKTFSSTGGWVGITTNIGWRPSSAQSQNFDASYLGATTAGDVKAYQANYRLPARVIAPGSTAQVSHRLFAGAKVVDILRGYEKSQGIARFDNAVDWGWFWFLTHLCSGCSTSSTNSSAISASPS